MNEEQIEELKNALREIVQLVIARGEPLSDDLKMVLAEVMEHVATRIQELRQEAQAPPPQTPPLEPGNFPSSNINAFNYDPKTQKLFVKFQDKYPSQNGPVYQYDGVPNFIFDIFRRGAVAPKTSGRNAWHTWKRGVTPSLGASMAALIKNGGYAYNRLA
jgi:hypothetical protein